MRKEFVKVPVMSYEIVLKAIYTFDELSNDAKQRLYVSVFTRRYSSNVY